MSEWRRGSERVDDRSGRLGAPAAQGDDLPAALGSCGIGLGLAAEFRPFLGEQPALLEAVAAPVRRLHLVAERMRQVSAR